jgi:hypothetical protein
VLTVVLIVALAVAIALAVVLLDRAAVGLAERKSSEFLSEPFGHPAVVRVHGRPFLTQAVRGRYADVTVVGGGLRIGEITGAGLDAHLRNIHLPLRELLGRRVRELACEHVAGHLVLPFGELARVARIPGLELTLKGETLTLDGGDSVWLRIRGVSVAGINLPGLMLTQLLPTLNVPIPLPVLPYGLRLDELRPTPAGLVVRGSAEAVVFRRLASRDDDPTP